jgi:hypothetical protein
MIDDAIETGTIVVWLRRSDERWVLDDREYSFPDVTQGPVRASFRKDRRNNLCVRLTGLFNEEFHFSVPLSPVKRHPHTDQPGLHVELHWRFPYVTLFLAGKSAQQLEAYHPDRARREASL